MRWIKSLFIIVVMISSMTVDAAHSLAPVEGAAIVVFAGEPCDDCRDTLSDCLVPTCEPPGVFGADTGTRSSPPARIMPWLAGGTGMADIDLQPVPPPPRG